MLEAKDNPHLIGRIALEAGFINPEQLERCLALQAADRPPRPLGRLLLETRSLTEEHLAEVLRIQKSRFERVAADPARGGLFGQLAVRLGYLKPEQLHDALRDQQASGRAGTSLQLGQVLLRRKMLTADQFLDLLRRQAREVVRCPACQAFYDLTGRGPVEPFLCTSCQAVVRPGSSART